LLRAARSRVVDTWQQFRTAGSLRVSLLYPPGPGPRLMSWLRKRWVIFRHPHAHLEFHGPVYLGPGFSLNMPHGGTFIVGPGVEFRRGFRAELGAPETRITMGRQSVFTYDAIRQCTTAIYIGSYCALGQASLVGDGKHRFRDLEGAWLWREEGARPGSSTGEQGSRYPPPRSRRTWRRRLAVGERSSCPKRRISWSSVTISRSMCSRSVRPVSDARPARSTTRRARRRREP